MRKKHLFFQLIIFAFLIPACTSETIEHKSTPDVSDIKIDVEIRRFEQDLFALDTNNVEVGIEPQVQALQKKYPDFFEVYTQQILTSPMEEELSDANKLKAFIQHPGVQKLHETTQIEYANIEDIESDLEQAFRYYKHYFPERPTPEVVSYISEYVVGTFTYGDSLLAIGWDFFMGQDFHYDLAVFPAFIQQSMDRQHLVSKAIEALASNLVDAPSNKRMLDFMINNGKTLYIKSLLLPNVSNHIIMEYTPEQMEWVEKNEREIWGYFLEEQLLYSTRLSDFQKLIGPSPMGTSKMPPEAPGKTANWIGWQIVKSYMANHSETTMEELVAMRDAQEVLDSSRYRPKR